MSDTATLTDSSTLRVHPALSLYPEMTGERVNMLAEDIRENGQQEPALVYQGQLLDGRARKKACEIAGVELRTVEYDGTNPVAAILSRNLRRDMTASQRACVAAMLCPWPKRGRPKMLKFEHLSETVAALRAGVSRTLVQTAVYVRDHDNELFQAATRGEIAISAAKAKIEARSDTAEANTGGAANADSANQPVPYMLRDIARTLASRKRTPEQTKQLIERLRAAGPQLIAVADQLASELADAGPDSVGLTDEQAAERHGVTLEFFQATITWNYYGELPNPGKDGKRHWPESLQEKLKEAIEQRQKEEAANAKKGRRSRTTPAKPAPPEKDKPTDQPASEQAATAGAAENLNDSFSEFLASGSQASAEFVGPQLPEPEAVAV